jgi:hypothetical protein
MGHSVETLVMTMTAYAGSQQAGDIGSRHELVEFWL